MKKYLFLLLIIICSMSVHAQIYIGMEGKLAINTDKQDYKSTILQEGYDLAGGGDFLIGYSFNNRINMSISAGKLWFLWNMFVEEYTLSSVEGTIKWFFIKKRFPGFFIGGGAGYYSEYFYADLPGIAEELKRHQFDFFPCLGYLFDSNITEGLYINAEVAYYNIFREKSISHFTFNLGTYYFFGK
ncbi:MAG: hypothetical protein ACOC31_04560 [Bacteroidota bacterium]